MQRTTDYRKGNAMDTVAIAPKVPKTFGVSFTAQSWDGPNRVTSLDGLSYDAARHVAKSHTALLGHTGRIMSDAEDYCEVYTPDGQTRIGTFAETTTVHF